MAPLTFTAHRRSYPGRGAPGKNGCLFKQQQQQNCCRLILKIAAFIVVPRHGSLTEVFLPRRNLYIPVSLCRGVARCLARQRKSPATGRGGSSAKEEPAFAEPLVTSLDSKNPQRPTAAEVSPKKNLPSRGVRTAARKSAVEKSPAAEEHSVKAVKQFTRAPSE